MVDPYAKFSFAGKSVYMLLELLKSSIDAVVLV
jgi:hypothetical protein